MNESQSSNYVPGVCNINRAEIAYRRKAGYAGLAIAIALLAVMLLLSLSRWYRLILFLPILIAAVGYLQVKNKFCVSYGASGLQNADDGSAKAQEVSAADKLKDKAKAQGMNRQAIIVSVVVTAVLLLIPEF